MAASDCKKTTKKKRGSTRAAAPTTRTTTATVETPEFPDLDAADIASMPPALKVALGSLMADDAARSVSVCRALLASNKLRPLPDRMHPWLPPGSSYALRLGPRAAAGMTPAARQALVWLLWWCDFKWVTHWGSGSGEGFGTHVHFGYAPEYGGRARDPADCGRMRFGADGVLRYAVAATGTGTTTGSADNKRQHKALLTAIEFPCDLQRGYIGVRAAK